VKSTCPESLFELALQSDGYAPASVAVVLRSADALGVDLPASALDAAARGLQLSHQQIPILELPSGYAEALASLARRRAPLEAVFKDASKVLCSFAPKSSEHRRLQRWLRQFMFSAVDSNTVWDCGLSVAFEAELKPELQQFETRTLISLAFVIQDVRAHRVGLWRALVAEMLTRVSSQDGGLLPHIINVIRRSPFVEMTCSSQSLALAAGAAREALECSSDMEVARLLYGFLMVMTTTQFLNLVVLPHSDVLRERLQASAQPGSCSHPGILHGLANGGGRSLNCRLRWPRWWRCLVLRPWGRLLRRVLTAVQAGPSAVGGRSAYTGRLCQLGMSDVGREWIFTALASMGVALPPHEFVQRACRQVLRRRRRLDAASPSAQRAMGFAAWRLQAGKDVDATITSCPGQLTSSVARHVNVEEELDSLLSADVGFHRRHGDVERMVLLAVMREIRRYAVQMESYHSSDISGHVDIYVDRVTCLSCMGVIAQFQRMFPGVKVRIALPLPPWLPRSLPSRRLYGVVRQEPQGTSHIRMLESEVRRI